MAVTDPGSIKNWQDVSLKICGWGSGFESCWNSCRMERERAFPSLAKIGPTPRQPTAFLPMGESKKRRFWRGISNPRGIALQRQNADSPILILHDTTEFTYSRSFRWLENMNQSTALLGEPQHCVHIGDRESDIYELFCAAQEAGTRFLVRTCVDRLARDGEQTISAEMKRVSAKGLHRIEVRDRNGELSEVVLELKWKRIQVLPPIGKNKQYPELTLTVIYAQERTSPKGRERIDWKLITNLPVRSRKDALQMLNWYALRWKIETFHKILKSGCKAEEPRLRTAERLVNLISSFCILAWRIFWMTMINRSSPEEPPTTALTDIEIKLLDRLIQDKIAQPQSNRSLSTYIVKLARLGGYLARSGDPPPGSIVMWRGLSRLVDIELGFSLGSQLVGNLKIRRTLTSVRCACRVKTTAREDWR
jgi:hypothetical protein